jgi:hypothetical protein
MPELRQPRPLTGFTADFRPLTSGDGDDPVGTAHVYRARRNGLPPSRPYVFGAPRAPWAVRAIAEAEAQYGKPVPVCGGCGTRLVFNGGHGHCPQCAPAPSAGHLTGCGGQS